MAAPLKTVPLWVPNVNNPCILFVTENYPKDPGAPKGNTYFYRTLLPRGVAVGANNLLDNLCKTFGIVGANESDKLKEFMFVKRFFLIDTFPSNFPMDKELINTTVMNMSWIDDIIDDIVWINPERIIFTCVGSNGKLLPILMERALERGLSIFDRVVYPPFPKDRVVFHSPSNRAYPTFDKQIKAVIKAGIIKCFDAMS